VMGVLFENLIEPLAGGFRLEADRGSAIRPSGPVAEHPRDVGIAMNLDTRHVGLRGVPSFQIARDRTAERRVGRHYFLAARALPCADIRCSLPRVSVLMNSARRNRTAEKSSSIATILTGSRENSTWPVRFRSRFSTVDA